MKKCDTCIYRNENEYHKPCIVYRDDCEHYEKERGDMTREQAIYYLQSSGFSEEQIATIERAFKQEPCGDAISRQAVLDLVADYDLSMGQVVRGIHALPSVTQEPKTGYWVMPVQDDGMSDPIYYQVRCSECGFDLDPQTWHQELHQYDADKFCPNCGCRMFEPQESENKE